MNLVSVNPNPVVSTLNITVFCIRKQQAIISIANVSGRSSQKTVIYLETGRQEFTFPAPPRKGNYVATIYFDKGPVTTRFVKL